MNKEYQLILDEDKIPRLKCVRDLEEYSGMELNTPSKVASFMKSAYSMENLAEEYCYLICFDTKLNVIGTFEVSHGTVDMSLIQPRDVYVRALTCGASGIILVHNHPSGDTHPSKADISVTEDVKSAGKLMHLELKDHIIIGKNYFSFSEEGYL